MNWTTGDKYFIHSGPYIVAKYWTAEGWRYGASMNKQRLGFFDSADAAREVCRQHSEGRN